MTTTTTPAAPAGCERADLARGRTAYLVWGVPWAAVLAGAFAGVPLRAVLWPLAFAVMGLACVRNAARCGRLHCFLTGPLYLGAAAASILAAAGATPPWWGWIGWSALAGTMLAHVPERIRGPYVAAAPAGREGEWAARDSNPGPAD